MSTAFSLEGWNVMKFLNGNGKALKEILKFAVPFVIARLTLSFPGAEYAVGIIGKGVLDIAEFYLKKVDL